LSDSYNAKVGKIYFLNAVLSIKSIRLLNDQLSSHIYMTLALTSTFDFLISIAVLSYNWISPHKSQTIIQRLPRRAAIRVFKPRKKFFHLVI